MKDKRERDAARNARIAEGTEEAITDPPVPSKEAPTARSPHVQDAGEDEG